MHFTGTNIKSSVSQLGVHWYYIDTLKRELIDTNAYKLQASLSEKVVVDGRIVIQPYILVSKANENQDKVPTLYWLPKPYKARCIANSSSCTTTELSKLLTSCLTAVKKMILCTVKWYMKNQVRVYFGLLKIQFKIELKLEIPLWPVCLHMSFLLFTLLNLII